MKISPARAAAFDILLRIETQSAFSSILLPQFEATLETRDRSLCHELVLGVLRRQICLDRVIGLLTKNKKLDLEVRIALRIALFQILHLDKVPDFSAVNESVALTIRAKKTSAKGLVNAVLRNAIRGIPEIVFVDDIDRVSTVTSHPRWLIEKWTNDLGASEAEQLANANNKPPAISFRSTVRGEGVDLSLLGTPSAIVDGAFTAGRMHKDLRSAFEQGLIYFQDEGSQLVAKDAEPKHDQRFLDACAAPGSKTTLVAKAIDTQCGLIVAGDLHSARIRSLVENCKNQGADFVRIGQYDAVYGLPFARNSFDVVLTDVPCSGTGTIRHNPEIRYTVQPDDLADLASKQLAVLENASYTVKPGCRLIYSTCSLEIEENERVVGSFLSRTQDFEIRPPQVPSKYITSGNFARTFPHRDKMDGFFIAELVRRPA